MFVPAYQISHCQISLRHPFHHSKSDPIDTPSPFHHLKSYPIDSQLTAKHSDPSIPEYKISHFVTLSITQIPIPATANQRPIPVTWIWYGRRHVSVVRDQWCSQHSTHISVEYCDKYRIISVVYDCLHSRTIGYPIVMVQTLLWVMVEWSDVNVV